MLTTRRSATSASVRPSATSASTSTSRAVSPSGVSPSGTALGGLCPTRWRRRSGSFVPLVPLHSFEAIVSQEAAEVGQHAVVTIAKLPRQRRPDRFPDRVGRTEEAGSPFRSPTEAASGLRSQRPPRDQRSPNSTKSVSASASCAAAVSCRRIGVDVGGDDQAFTDDGSVACTRSSYCLPCRAPCRIRRRRRGRWPS